MRLARTSVLLAVLTAACSPSPDVEPTASSGAGAGDAPLAQDHRRRNVEAYRAAVRANPSDGEARFRLAQALVENGDWGAAAPEAIRAADLLPDRDDIQVLAVSMLLGQQRFAEALDRISPRRAANPGDPRWHILFGNATAGLPNSWSAIEHYDREWRSGRRLARIPPGQRQEAQDQRADEAFRRAVTLAPGRPEATTALGNLAWARGRMREGNAHLRRVADQNPHDVLLNRALGLSYLTADQHQDAETYLRAAAASGEPDSVRVLADFYASHERLEEALTTIGRLAGGPDPGGVMALHAARGSGGRTPALHLQPLARLLYRWNSEAAVPQHA